MLKPSNNFVVYDAQKYEKDGFIKFSGRVRQLARKPRFWQVTATPITFDKDNTEKDRTHIKFVTSERTTLNDLAPIINDHIFTMDGFLEKCSSVIVCAKVLTEGGQ